MNEKWSIKTFKNGTETPIDNIETIFFKERPNFSFEKHVEVEIAVSL